MNHFQYKNENQPKSSQLFSYILFQRRGWSGGAMVLGKLPVPGRPTVWMTVGQGPIVLALGASGGCLDIFTLVYAFLLFLPLSGRQSDID